MNDPVYLDYAAATPLDPRVLAVMQPYFSQQFYNPSALYNAARQTRKELENARAKVAQTLGARPSEIIFTAGGTESDNLAIAGIMRRYPGAHMVTSSIEHDAVLSVSDQFNATYLPVRPDGLVEISELLHAVTDQTVLVSIMYANNEIGTVQPIHKIAQAIQKIKDDRRTRGVATPLYFHSDACQAANFLDLHVARLGVDLLTVNGGKIYGPKQSGILYVRGGIDLEPLVYGGGQERGLRSGTENVAACIGFAEALELAQGERQAVSNELKLLQKQFIDELLAVLPQAAVHGSRKMRLPNNVHITIPGIDNERVLVQLDEMGIMASAGSACSASSDTPSHVLRAIGLSDVEAQTSLRFSMGRTTTAQQIAYVIDALRSIVA